MTTTQLTKFIALADRLKRLSEMKSTIKQNGIEFLAGTKGDNFLNDLPDVVTNNIADVVNDSVIEEMRLCEEKIRKMLDSDSAYQ